MRHFGAELTFAGYDRPEAGLCEVEVWQSKEET